MESSLQLILLSAAIGVCGQLTLKVGMTRIGRIGPEALAQPLQVVQRVLSTPFILGGLGLYVVGAAVWMTVLSRVPLSFAYPVLAVSYAFTPVLAWLLLGEKIPAVRWVGIATICVGVFLVSRS
jgi:drug/metabolite transporter (DMT)-like permease